MELIYLISILVALLVLLLTLLYFKNQGGAKGKFNSTDLTQTSQNYKNQLSLPVEKQQIAQNQQPQQQRAAPLNRRPGRNRVIAAEQHEPQNQQHGDEEDSDNESGIVIDEKMGAKKRAKLEAKAEKRAQREAELKAREEQKKRDGRKINFHFHLDDSHKFLMICSARG
jgi:FtsZ-interacting cell division protein ZipA